MSVLTPPPDGPVSPFPPRTVSTSPWTLFSSPRRLPRVGHRHRARGYSVLATDVPRCARNCRAGSSARGDQQLLARLWLRQSGTRPGRFRVGGSAPWRTRHGLRRPPMSWRVVHHACGVTPEAGDGAAGPTVACPVPGGGAPVIYCFPDAAVVAPGQLPHDAQRPRLPMLLSPFSMYRRAGVARCCEARIISRNAGAHIRAQTDWY